MNNNIVIASDSTCDLSRELIDRYGIKIVPLGVELGGTLYTDGVDITPDMIYEHYAKTGQLPQTSAVNIAEFEDFFKKNTENGESVILFTISSSMSSTFRNAELASESFENVHVVDTANLSTGGGLLIIRAAEMAEEGIPAAEIAENCRKLAPFVDASFVVDDLEFLYKGGRCSALAAFGANVLSIKPSIVVRNGKMSVGKKYRGKFGATLKKYIEDQLDNIEDIDTSHIFVTHAGCDPDVCDACVDTVKKIADFKNIHITRAGCTVSSHCGKNTLGVLFIRKSPLE